MELKKYNANHTQVLKINQIVRTISETHKFDKDKLIAINTSDVENGVMGNGTLTFVDELKGQFKKTIVKDDILFSEIRPANRRFAKVTTKNTKGKRLRDSTYETKNKRLVSFGLLISLFPHVWKQFPVFF